MNDRGGLDVKMVELTWEQVQFLWNTKNRNFFRLYDDDTEAMVDTDEWESILKHHENGGRFGIENDSLYKIEVTISDEKRTYRYNSPECGYPDAEELHSICRKHEMYGELEVHAVALTVEDEYVDSVEYGIYVSEDRIYLEEGYDL